MQLPETMHDQTIYAINPSCKRKMYKNNTRKSIIEKIINFRKWENFADEKKKKNSLRTHNIHSKTWTDTYYLKRTIWTCNSLYENCMSRHLNTFNIIMAVYKLIINNIVVKFNFLHNQKINWVLYGLCLKSCKIMCNYSILKFLCFLKK